MNCQKKEASRVFRCMYVILLKAKKIVTKAKIHQIMLRKCQFLRDVIYNAHNKEMGKETLFSMQKVMVLSECRSRRPCTIEAFVGLESSW